MWGSYQLRVFLPKVSYIKNNDKGKEKPIMLNQECYICVSAKRAHNFITPELILSYISAFKGFRVQLDFYTSAQSWTVHVQLSKSSDLDLKST